MRIILQYKVVILASILTVIGFLAAYRSYQQDFHVALPKPVFSDFGKERIHEYLDQCLATKTIPEVVWVFWFNADPSTMSENRAKAFKSMEGILQLPVILIYDDNVRDFLRWPVHEAVWLLSGVHISDYFRVYFTFHYGGYDVIISRLLIFSSAYSDIKHHKESWGKYFTQFHNPNTWIVGIPEIPGGVAWGPLDESGPWPGNDCYQKLISNGFWIARPDNPMLAEVHQLQHKTLDRKKEDLKAHPPPIKTRCCQSDPQGYPIRWAELLGEKMSIVGLKYHTHLARVIAWPHLTDYI